MTALLKVIEAKEPWAEYQLEDGTLLRFRFSACSFRLTGAKTQQGDPEYTFASQVQIETHAKVAPDPVLKLVMSAGEPSGYQAPNEDAG